MSVETAVKDVHVRKVCEGPQRSIRAAAVNHDISLAQARLDSVRLIFWFLVIRQQNRRSLIKHLQVHVRQTHGLDV
jgi:hypothetical protein